MPNIADKFSPEQLAKAGLQRNPNTGAYSKKKPSNQSATNMTSNYSDEQLAKAGLQRNSDGSVTRLPRTMGRPSQRYQGPNPQPNYGPADPGYNNEPWAKNRNVDARKKLNPQDGNTGPSYLPPDRIRAKPEPQLPPDQLPQNMQPRSMRAGGVPPEQMPPNLRAGAQNRRPQDGSQQELGNQDRFSILGLLGLLSPMMQQITGTQLPIPQNYRDLWGLGAQDGQQPGQGQPPQQGIGGIPGILPGGFGIPKQAPPNPAIQPTPPNQGIPLNNEQLGQILGGPLPNLFAPTPISQMTGPPMNKPNLGSLPPNAFNAQPQ